MTSIIETTKYCIGNNGVVNNGSEYAIKCAPNALLVGGLLGLIVVGLIFAWAYWSVNKKYN